MCMGGRCMNKRIFETAPHKTYKCENQVSKHCRLIEESPIDHRGKNVCVACFSKLKDLELSHIACFGEYCFGDDNNCQ